MEINRKDALIMTKLNKSKARNEINAMTINEINDCGGVEQIACRSHLIRRLQFLEENGYIAKGLKSGNAVTYYVTSAGIAYLDEKKAM